MGDFYGNVLHELLVLKRIVFGAAVLNFLQNNYIDNDKRLTFDERTSLADILKNGYQQEQLRGGTVRGEVNLSGISQFDYQVGNIGNWHS